MPRVGIDRETGQVLTGWDHCAQSLVVIVSTLVGERVELRDFGYDGPPIQDRPGNAFSIARHFSAIAQSVWRWEPAYRLRALGVTDLARDGVSGFSLTGDFFPEGHVGDFSQVETGRSIVVPLKRAGALS